MKPRAILKVVPVKKPKSPSLVKPTMKVKKPTVTVKPTIKKIKY